MLLLTAGATLALFLAGDFAKNTANNTLDFAMVDLGVTPSWAARTLGSSFARLSSVSFWATRASGAYVSFLALRTADSAHLDKFSHTMLLTIIVIARVLLLDRVTALRVKIGIVRYFVVL